LVWIWFEFSQATVKQIEKLSCPAWEVSAGFGADRFVFEFDEICFHGLFDDSRNHRAVFDL
jgi:hypothetical protein